MAKVTEKRPDGTTVIVVPADKLPPIEIADIKAARQEALLGKAE